MPGRKKKIIEVQWEPKDCKGGILSLDLSLQVRDKVHELTVHL